MNQLYAAATLESFSDGSIIEEAAKRLQAIFKKSQNVSFMFGTFRFVFHNGLFQGVEEWPRNKSYLSPKRLLSLSDRGVAK